MKQKIEIVQRIMNANDNVAENVDKKLRNNGIYAINIMASPGAGKTSFILATIRALPQHIRLGVIEGDTAPVTIDSDKVRDQGIPVVQINTGGECHLDAPMIDKALNHLPIDNLDMVIVENVGNLICPAAFKLGTRANVLIASIPEGDDKPYKYPNIYRGLDVLIINKTDLLPYLDFRMDYFRKGVEMLNPGLTTFEVSCKSNQGLDEWVDWLSKQLQQSKLA